MEQYLKFGELNGRDTIFTYPPIILNDFGQSAVSSYENNNQGMINAYNNAKKQEAIIVNDNPQLYQTSEYSQNSNKQSNNYTQQQQIGLADRYGQIEKFTSKDNINNQQYWLQKKLLYDLQQQYYMQKLQKQQSNSLLNSQYDQSHLLFVFLIIIIYLIVQLIKQKKIIKCECGKVQQV